jgi:hypothetical protein
MKRKVKYPKIQSTCISQEVWESLLLLANQGVDTAELCRRGISNEVSKALRQIKKSS